MLRVKFTVRELQALLLNRSKEYGSDFRVILTLLTLSGLLLCFGCSGANYGSLKHSRDVTQAFETYHTDTPWLRDDDRRFGTGIGVGSGRGGIGIRINR